MPVTINGSAGVTTNSGAVYDSLQRGTAVTVSGTEVLFTGIPSWVERVTVMLSGVSTNGTGQIQIQLGDSGGIENSGYSGSVDTTVASVSAELFTTGLAVSRAGVMGATAVFSGQAVFSLVGSNTWVGSGLFARTNTAGVSLTACTKTLSDTLTQLRIIGSATGSPSDTFDAGTINIIYE
jgi:hypothetical protein